MPYFSPTFLKASTAASTSSRSWAGGEPDADAGFAVWRLRR